MITGLPSSAIRHDHLRRQQSAVTINTSAASEHLVKLSPANMSDQAAAALVAGTELPDKVHSAIARLALNAIADGAMNLCSTNGKDATFKLLLSQENTSPGELLACARKNDQERYDIFELKHKSYASGPMETFTVMERPLEVKDAPDSEGTTGKASKFNSLLSTLATDLHRQALPKPSEYALKLIEKKDNQFISKKLNRREARELYRDLEKENNQCAPADKKSEDELWEMAINEAGYSNRSSISTRNRLALRDGKSPAQAKAVAVVNTLFTPIGLLRKALTPERVKARREAEMAKFDYSAVARRPDAPLHTSRPKRDSLESLDFLQSNVSSNDTLRRGSPAPRPQSSEPDDLMIRAGEAAYQSVSPEVRAALDAILELLDKKGEAGLSEISNEARDSLYEFEELARRFSYVDAMAVS